MLQKKWTFIVLSLWKTLNSSHKLYHRLKHTWKSFEKLVKTQPTKKNLQNLQTSTSHRQTNNNPHPCLLGFFSLIGVEWKTRFCSFWICQVCSVFNCAYICEFRVYLSKNDFCRSLYRCVVLSDPLKDSSRSQESWNAFLTKLRTLLLMSFTKNLGKFEDDMRTLREKRTEPGWSFCEYFMVQVRVSFYWRKYLSSSFDNGCFFVVVGFLVLSVFWSFLESWGRKYEDWYKSSIFTSLDLYGAGVCYVVIQCCYRSRSFSSFLEFCEHALKQTNCI